MEKTCFKCQEQQPIENFYAHAKMKDGRFNKCKACARADTAAYEAANPEKTRAGSIRTYEKNKEKYRAKNREWAAAHPLEMQAYKAKNRAMRRGCSGSYTADDVRSLLTLQRWKCAACRTSLKTGYHVDHIFPLARGGSNDKANLQMLCPVCNVSKNARHPVDFMQKKGFLL